MQQQIFDEKVRDLSPEVHALARKAELGELRKIYHATKRNTGFFIFGLISLVEGLLWTAFAILVVIWSSFTISPLWLLPGIFFTTLGFWLLIPGKIYARWHVYLWESGFLYEKGPLREVFRWDQIESLQCIPTQSFQAPHLSFYAYKVRRRDGYVVKLNTTFGNAVELSDVLLGAFLHQASPDELTITPSRNRTFGACTIDRDGIRDPQGALGWSEIEELTIEKGSLTALTRKVDKPASEQV